MKACIGADWRRNVACFQLARGRNDDYDLQPERTAADAPAIGIAYRSGLYNMGNNMHLPIIDLRGHDIAEIHHDYRSYVMRARLDRKSTRLNSSHT